MSEMKIRDPKAMTIKRPIVSILTLRTVTDSIMIWPEEDKRKFVELNPITI